MPQYLCFLLSIIAMFLESRTLFWDYPNRPAVKEVEFFPHFVGFVRLGHEGTLAGKVYIRFYVANELP